MTNKIPSKRLFSDLKLKDIGILLLMVGVAIVVSYLYANNQARGELWKTTYPIRANLSIKNLTCSPDAPSWMADLLTYKTIDNNAPSNQVAYIDKFGTLHHCENGYKDKYPLISEPITTDTRFRYASITKLWTADAILDIVKQGQIDLDDRVVEYLTEIDNPIDPRMNNITIRQLLLHRGGFDRHSLNYGNNMFGFAEPLCPNQLERFNNVELGFTPDEKTSYSNIGYCLLGEVIARIDNKPYTEAIYTRYSFINSSLQFIDNERASDEVFYNYVETGLTGLGDIYTVFDYKAAASSAGLSGNAIDLVQQVRQLIAKPQPNIVSMDTNNSTNCNYNKLRNCYSYAMIPYHEKGNGSKIFYRDGKLPGLSSLVAVTEDNEVVAILSNGEPKAGEQNNDYTKFLIYEYFNKQ